MQKQLIASAKEKGFESHIIGKSVEAKYSNKDFYYLWMCELQKWLREEYKIDIWITDRSDMHQNGYGIVISGNDFESIELNEYMAVGTYYEEALEEGLKEALKLI